MPKRKNGFRAVALILLIAGILLLVISFVGITFISETSTNPFVIFLKDISPEVGGVGLGFLALSGLTFLLKRKI